MAYSGITLPYSVAVHAQPTLSGPIVARLHCVQYFLSRTLSVLGGSQVRCHFVEWFLDCVDALFLQQLGDTVGCPFDVW
jgi:hypothetical protein